MEEAPAAATRLNRWVCVELQDHDSEADGEHAEDDLALPRLDNFDKLSSKLSRTC